MTHEECLFCKGKTVSWDLVEKGQRPMGLTISILGSMCDVEIDGGEKRDGIWLEDGVVLKYDNSSGEYVPQGIEIAYCPFCGEALKVKEDPDEADQH